MEVEIATTLMMGADFSKAMFLGVIQMGVLLVLNISGVFVKEYEIIGNGESRKVSFLFSIYSFSKLCARQQNLSPVL